MQHHTGHLLDLLFDRFSVTGDGLFDLHGSVFVNGHTALGGSQQDHTAGFRHADDCSLVMLIV